MPRLNPLLISEWLFSPVLFNTVATKWLSSTQDVASPLEMCCKDKIHTQFSRLSTHTHIHRYNISNDNILDLLLKWNILLTYFHLLLFTFRAWLIEKLKLQCDLHYSAIGQCWFSHIWFEHLQWRRTHYFSKQNTTSLNSYNPFKSTTSLSLISVSLAFGWTKILMISRLKNKICLFNSTCTIDKCHCIVPKFPINASPPEFFKGYWNHSFPKDNI